MYILPVYNEPCCAAFWKCLMNKISNRPNAKFLVFTSAGDASCLRLWRESGELFDLCVVYYGDNADCYRDAADYYLERKGSKFSNLHFVWSEFEGFIEKYDAILVLDDDIIMSGVDIDSLFQIRDEYDLSIAHPSFSSAGKISHSITKVDPFCKLRYTDFVEVGCPLFRREVLENFLRVYDPVLVGWGIDWWFLHTIKNDIHGKVAIVDDVCCINPKDWMKKGEREIDKLSGTGERKRQWESIKEKHGIVEHEPRELGRVRKSALASLNQILTLLKIRLVFKLYKFNLIPYEVSS